MKVLNIIDSDTRKPVPFEIKNKKIIILSSGVHNNLEVIVATEDGNIVSHVYNHQKSYSSYARPAPTNTYITDD